MLSLTQMAATFSSCNLFLISSLCTYWLLCCCLPFPSANAGIIVSDGPGNGKTLISDGRTFELGFFSLQNRRYLGIWFHLIKPQNPVWVANRDNPLSGQNGVLAITEDGKLNLLELESKTAHWSADNVENGHPGMRTVKLTDSGNLVLSQGNRTLWQSFDYPTDTFLPGMNILNLKKDLTSWASMDDPRPGNFTFKMDPERRYQYLIRAGQHTLYWKSGIWVNDDGMTPVVRQILSGDTDIHLIRYSGMVMNYTGDTGRHLIRYSRMVMSYNGSIEWLIWRGNEIGWGQIWSQPSDRCSQFEACGRFASCSSESRHKCRCLPGFEPISKERWSSGEFSDGCRRTSDIFAKGVVDMEYLRLNVKLQKTEIDYPANDSGSCEIGCKADRCEAYSESETSASRRYNSRTCFIWKEDLQNIWQVEGGGSVVYVPVVTSDLKYTERDCPTCGTNIIPYPLSTGPNCGDRTYRHFSCDNSTDRAYFNISGVQYIITGIDPEQETFSILVNKSVCGAKDVPMVLNLKQPYVFSRGCESGFISSSSNSVAGEAEYIELEIKWKKALEPICSTSEGCRIWPNSACTLKDGIKRCLCNSSFEWNGTKCTGSAFYVSQQLLESKKNQSRFPFSLVVPLTIAIFTLISCLTFYIYHKRTKGNNQQEEGSSSWYNRENHLYNSEKRVKEFIESGEFGEDDRKAIEVPVFDLDTILGATDNFSDANKIGQGGFGAVYKGKFPGGLEIAIKRLSKGSSQGVDEFKNEVVLIAKLQHRNLVRLLGYCVAGDEIMLLYEYMPNKSLDSFIFDRTLCLILNWEMRFNIIWGIARGLLYLHEDSRLRVIHRDLKTSNVLLDAEMNPKISDFGLARIVDGNQMEVTTKRVVGTYGYMSPEYALDGHFSIKSDVFSFGVVVLEIVSGKRNTGFYQSAQAISLLGYAWKLWGNETPLEMLDPVLRENCNPSEVIKCINVGLVCVQEDPIDRPSMSSVAFMLSSGCDSASLPNPRQPAFVARRHSLSTEPSFSSNRPTATATDDTHNDFSLLQPR